MDFQIKAKMWRTQFIVKSSEWLGLSLVGSGYVLAGGSPLNPPESRLYGSLAECAWPLFELGFWLLSKDYVVNSSGQINLPCIDGLGTSCISEMLGTSGMSGFDGFHWFEVPWFEFVSDSSKWLIWPIQDISTLLLNSLPLSISISSSIHSGRLGRHWQSNVVRSWPGWHQGKVDDWLIDGGGAYEGSGGNEGAAGLFAWFWSDVYVVCIMGRVSISFVSGSLAWLFSSLSLFDWGDNDPESELGLFDGFGVDGLTGRLVGRLVGLCDGFEVGLFISEVPPGLCEWLGDWDWFGLGFGFGLKVAKGTVNSILDGSLNSWSLVCGSFASAMVFSYCLPFCTV